jgi:hypothetical protein
MIKTCCSNDGERLSSSTCNVLLIWNGHKTLTGY